MVLTKLKIIVKGPTGGGKSTVIGIIKEALSSCGIASRRTLGKEHELSVIVERPAFPKKKEEEDENSH